VNSSATAPASTRVGRDGKTYPAGWTLPEAERRRAAALAHALVHRDRLSIRAAQKIMLESFAVRRSVGSIWGDLRAYTCKICRIENNQTHQAATGQGRAE
jgi:hypothetical protein